MYGLLGQAQLGFFHLFDVHVLEGDHPHLLDEPSRPVHVPDPRVGQPQLEVDLALGIARHQLDAVGQVEPPLGLHYIAELADDVLVFAVERELHLGFILLEIFGTHRLSCPSYRSLPILPYPTSPRLFGSTSASIFESLGSSPQATNSVTTLTPFAVATRRTLMNEYRCWLQGPSSASAALWAGVL